MIVALRLISLSAVLLFVHSCTTAKKLDNSLEIKITLQNEFISNFSCPYLTLDIPLLEMAHFKIESKNNKLLTKKAEINLAKHELCAYGGFYADQYYLTIVFSHMRHYKILVNSQDGLHNYEAEQENAKRFIAGSKVSLLLRDKGAIEALLSSEGDGISQVDFSHDALTPIKEENDDNENLAKAIATNALNGFNVYVIADTTMYQRYGSSTKTELIALMAQVNTVYERELKIAFRVGDLVVWDTANEFAVTANPEETVTNAALYYRRQNRPEHVLHFFTNTNYGITAGIAFVGGICFVDRKAGLTSAHERDSSFQIKTVIHELGHNLGLSHTPGTCKCEPFEECIMRSSLSTLAKTFGFSSCVKKQIAASISDGKFTCLNSKTFYTTVSGDRPFAGAEAWKMAIFLTLAFLL